MSIDEETVRERQSRATLDDSMSEPKKFKPPKCSSCGKPLWAVYEHEYWTYSFDERTGIYKENLDAVEIRCTDCNAKLYDVFPEGACNYQT